jgi:hypothetical protein
MDVHIEKYPSSAQDINPWANPWTSHLDYTETPHDMDNSIGAQVQVADVKFFPPLHEQRRSWALDILRRERVTTV